MGKDHCWGRRKYPYSPAELSRKRRGGGHLIMSVVPKFFPEFLKSILSISGWREKKEWALEKISGGQKHPGE